jgi:hypothetical protein
MCELNDHTRDEAVYGLVRVAKTMCRPHRPELVIVYWEVREGAATTLRKVVVDQSFVPELVPVGHSLTVHALRAFLTRDYPGSVQSVALDTSLRVSAQGGEDPLPDNRVRHSA